MTMTKEVVHAANSDEVLGYADRTYPVRDRLKIQKIGAGQFSLAVGVLDSCDTEERKKSYVSRGYPGRRRNRFQ